MHLQYTRAHTQIHTHTWYVHFTLQTHCRYYYYNTVPNATYQQTMIDVYKYAQSTSPPIPYRYCLYDSWWYLRGVWSMCVAIACVMGQ